VGVHPRRVDGRPTGRRRSGSTASTPPNPPRGSLKAVGHQDESRRAEFRARFEKFADRLGIERKIDIGDLTYNDPNRANVTEWLNAHGWTATGTPSVEEMRRLGRWTEVPMATDSNAFATFVIGERTATG
jgi:O-methyltransferase involved in polyketide biosynthesis